MLQELLGHLSHIRQQLQQQALAEGIMHPGQLVLDTLACENAEMTAQSLEGWYQEYGAKRAAMGVVVNYKEATSAATCMNLTSQFH